MMIHVERNFLEIKDLRNLKENINMENNFLIKKLSLIFN